MKLFKAKKISMIGVKRGALDQARGRVVLLSGLFVLVYIIIVARAFDVSIIQSRNFEVDVAFEAINAQETPSNQRADIVDRNGVLLARSLKTASLYADPSMIENPVEVSKGLSGLFPSISYGDLLQKLQSKKRFVWIKRNLTPDEQESILYLGSPGLYFKEEDRRIYPQGELTVHAVGYSSVDGQGLSGIEASFDKLLREQPEPLTLTLDVRLQHALRREMRESINKHQAQGGAGVIMDVTNGEILAAVSYPDFDPHHFSKVKKSQKFNRFSLGVYELGSTFKIFSTAALLEKNNVPMSYKFDAREPIKVSRYTIRDYHPQKRMLSLPEVFMHSSNIGSALMGDMVGTKGIKKFYSDLGLTKASSIELGEVGEPLMPKPWREINTMTACFGHGIAVSPMQLVSAASSIVNGGVAINPTLILNDNQHNNDMNRSDLRIVSPQTAHRIRQLMRLVVTEGTGSQADVAGYQVGGKTGTAEKIGAKGYDRKRLLSSFLGVFPMDMPRYAIFIVIDEPKGTKETYGYATGGWVAAPAVQKVILSMVSILGISAKEDSGLEKNLMRFVKTEEQIQQEKLNREVDHASY